MLNQSIYLQSTDRLYFSYNTRSIPKYYFQNPLSSILNPQSLIHNTHSHDDDRYDRGTGNSVVMFV